MSVTTEGTGGGDDGGEDPGDRPDDLLQKVVEHATTTAKKRKAADAKAKELPPVKKPKQATITNYFAPVGKAPADSQVVPDEVLAANKPVTVPDNIMVDGEEGEFVAKDTKTDKEVAWLTLYWDEADEIYWVNNIEVKPKYRRRGIATAMLKHACDEHHTIYFPPRPPPTTTTRTPGTSPRTGTRWPGWPAATHASAASSPYRAASSAEMMRRRSPPTPRRAKTCPPRKTRPATGIRPTTRKRNPSSPPSRREDSVSGFPPQQTSTSWQTDDSTPIDLPGVPSL